MPLRSIFHILPNLTTYLQGTKLTSFFPSSALYICQYLIYSITVLLPCKLLFPSHVKEKPPGVTSIYHYCKSISFCQSLRQSHPFFLPYRRPPFSPQSFPSASLLSVTIKVLTSWRHNNPGGNTRQLLQHQSMVPGRNTAASQGPAPWDAHLCSWQRESRSLAQKYPWSLLLFPSTGDLSPET